ncbi:unnamed protein product [Adineta ricciae]|uniref:Uncharacterized protein n=1 Tax=Adineta ricciae TaxID=249248 RepID=A0A813R3D5_ADIRI|nr:unnamed protein product [Adineta ricciae]CAF1164952.1 unnamed protein product [Adineta ricciae]
MKAFCIIGLAGLAISATVMLALIPVYLPNYGVSANNEYSDEQYITYNLPDSILLSNGSLADTQLKNFETAMQENLANDGKTRGSLISVKNGTAFTTSSKRKRRAQVIGVSSEGQSTISTTRHCKLTYIIKLPRSDLLKVRRLQLLQYIKQTVLTNLTLSGFDLDRSKTLSGANVSLAYPNDEYAFNQANAPITLQLSSPILDVTNYTLFSGNTIAPIVNTTSTNANITINNGFPPGHTFLTLIALDIYGLPLFYSFSLYFGSISMSIKVLYENNTVVSDAFVQINVTDFTRVSQSAKTDANGIALFTNVPPTTISVFAYTSDNQIGLAGIQPKSGELVVTLIPFHGSSKRRRRSTDEGTPFDIYTNNVQALQTKSATFLSLPDAAQIYVEYQFITAEVPGGYFGTQYNDYFSITIRSNTSTYRTVTQSMNSLGLGAFDYASGATNIYKLTMPVGHKPESIQIDIAVSNVADGLYQSRLKVHRYGSDGCGKCENNCIKCKSDPMCSSSCANPPMKSCDFYLSCMERKAPCGLGGYANNYGNVYCTKFVQNLNRFSVEGQTWIYNTMNCLQKALVLPLKNCVKSCSVLQSVAFSSHPSCYVNNGVCELPALDYISLFPVVGPGLLSKAGIIQALLTAPQCIPSMNIRITAAFLAVPDFKTRLALLILRKWLLSLLN